eukprot:scaffold7597_cov66-Attheya_sp.AAC.3
MAVSVKFVLGQCYLVAWMGYRALPRLSKWVTIFLPILSLLLACVLGGGEQRRTGTRGGRLWMVVVALCCSSLVLFGMMYETAPIWWRLGWNLFSSSAEPMALELLRDREASGRIVTRNGYNLYLPPTASSTSCSTADDSDGAVPKKREGFVLFPGALVDSRAYSPVAAQLSDKGIMVAVTTMIPLRWSIPSVEYDSILKSILKEDDQRTWDMGGHSMGAYAAMHLSDVMLCKAPFDVDVARKRNRKLVVIAAGNVEFLVPDLSERVELDVLLIQGSKDGFANFRSDEEAWKFRTKMPPTALTEQMIEGGNHMGFGAIPPSSFDGTRTISLNQQHKETCSILANFLLSTNISKKID